MYAMHAIYNIYSKIYVHNNDVGDGGAGENDLIPFCTQFAPIIIYKAQSDNDDDATVAVHVQYY